MKAHELPKDEETKNIEKRVIIVDERRDDYAVCEYCGKEFNPQEVGRHRVCSDECFLNYEVLHKEPLVEVKQPNFTKQESKNELHFQITMSLALRLYREGGITENDYREFYQKMIDKYHPVYGDLFWDFDLILPESKEVKRKKD